MEGLETIYDSTLIAQNISNTDLEILISWIQNRSICKGERATSVDGSILFGLTCWQNAIVLLSSSQWNQIESSMVFDKIMVFIETEKMLVSKSACNVVLQWLRHTPLQTFGCYLGEVVDSLLKCQENNICRLEIIKDLLSSPRMTQHLEQRCCIKEKKLITLKNIHCHWGDIVRKQIRMPLLSLKIDEFYSFLSLWLKVIKNYYNVIGKDETERRLLDMPMLDATPETLAESFLRPCLEIIPMLRQELPAFCYNKILDVLNRSLSFPSSIEVTPLHTIICSTILNDFGGIFTETLPHLVLGDVETFCGIQSTQHSTGSCSAYSKTPSTRSLRQVTLLHLRAMALLLRDQQDSSSGDPTTALMCSKGWLEFHRHFATRLHHGSSWLLVVLQDQDDQLVDVLDRLLDSYISLRKCECLPSRFDLQFNPHILHAQFLDTTSWDSSVLLDFLTSPETCFLAYFVHYLKFVLKDWKCFTNILLGNSCAQFASSTIQDMSSTEDNTGKKDSHTLQSEEADEDIFTDTIQDKSNNDTGCKPSNKIGLKTHKPQLTMEIKSTCRNKSLKRLVEYSDSEDSTDADSCQANNNQASQISKSNPESQMKCLIPKHARLAEPLETELIETGQIHKCHMFCESAQKKCIEMDDNEDNNSGGCGTTSAIPTHYFAGENSLDRVMTIWIRLRITIDNLQRADKFPYNAKHLVHLIECCEELYEE